MNKIENINSAQQEVLDNKSHEELLAWLKLAYVYRNRASEVMKLLQIFELPEAVFEASRATLYKITSAEDACALFSEETEKEADKAWQWLKSTASAQCITITDSDYPTSLLQSGNPDVLLFLRGNRKLLQSTKLTVALTERADDEGRRNAQDFCRALSRKGVCCVMQVETQAEEEAARAALNEKAGVIILSACGPDRVPTKDRKKVYVLAQEKGLIVSQVFPGKGSDKESIARRLFLAAAISQGILVIESERYGPVMQLSQYAGELGRDVAALPGSIHSVLYKGNHQLIRQGAKLTESVEDIFSDFCL